MNALFPNRPKPLVLAILDGWGEQPAGPDNAIALANTPCFDALKRDYPNTLINASELHVGLPEGQMGNSEVGHMNIGAGRVVMQDLPRIDAAINSGELAKNPALLNYIAALKKTGGTCHVFGLLSDGGVHSHIDHFVYLANTVAGAGVNVAIHACLDGRDTPPQSALGYLTTLESNLKPGVTIATISGRYFGMDRDKRYERVEKAYDAMVGASATRFASAKAYVEASYASGTNDEFVLPGAAQDYTGMKDSDGLLCINFRADRVRQMLGALLDKNFHGFSRKRGVKFAATLGMCSYSEALDPLIPALFQPQALTDIFGEIIARNGLTQLRIAETEKYAHVTFFFNGGREEPFTGEERILIQSPKVATYDLKPEMSAYEVTDALEKAIGEERFDVIIVNYANTDMVGHSGDLQAAMKAVEAVDQCLARLSKAVLAKNGAMLITADHGNAECMYDHDTKQPHTAHTLHLVPAILVANELKGTRMQAYEGKLADVAPTLLDILDLPIPAVMSGQSLLRFVE